MDPTISHRRHCSTVVRCRNGEELIGLRSSEVRALRGGHQRRDRLPKQLHKSSGLIRKLHRKAACFGRIGGNDGRKCRAVCNIVDIDAQAAQAALANRKNTGGEDLGARDAQKPVCRLRESFSRIVNGVGQRNTKRHAVVSVIISRSGDIRREVGLGARCGCGRCLVVLPPHPAIKNAISTPPSKQAFFANLGNKLFSSSECCIKLSFMLETAFQSKLKDARVVRIDRMQEGVASETTGSSRGIEVGLSAVAVDDIVAGVARIRGIGNAELGVIEDVEGFGAKLDVEAAPGAA